MTHPPTGPSTPTPPPGPPGPKQYAATLPWVALWLFLLGAALLLAGFAVDTSSEPRVTHWRPATTEERQQHEMVRELDLYRQCMDQPKDVWPCDRFGGDRG